MFYMALLIQRQVDLEVEISRLQDGEVHSCLAGAWASCVIWDLPFTSLFFQFLS